MDFSHDQFSIFFSAYDDSLLSPVQMINVFTVAFMVMLPKMD